MKPGNTQKYYDKQLDSILVHCYETQPSCNIKITPVELEYFHVSATVLHTALLRAEKKNKIKLRSFCAPEDIPEDSIQDGSAVVASLVYFPKGRRRMKGPEEICNKPTFSKGPIVACRDDTGVSIFYKKKRLYIGPKPDMVLAFLLENNGNSFSKHEIAKRVFDTSKTSNIAELISRINSTVATNTKQNLTKIIEKPKNSTYMVNV